MLRFIALKKLSVLILVVLSHEFNFSKFRRQPHDKELPSKDEIIGLASIVVPPTDPLE
jgi:hypothetical protein